MVVIGLRPPINRAEFTKIIIESVFDDATIDECVTAVAFPDVPTYAWFTKYVCVAKNSGIVSGYSDGTFGPINEINYAEAAKIVVEGFGYYTQPSEPWYETYTQNLANKHAVPSSIAGPSRMLTRGEMAYIMHKLLSYEDSGLVYNNLIYGFNLTLPSTWLGYAASIETGDLGASGTFDIVYFGFVEQNDLFAISRYTKNQWEEMLIEFADGGPMPTYLGENTDYVFGYSMGQYAANETMIDRMSEIQYFVSSFELVQ